ncbi:DUF6221 family protein [Streptomyces sp. 150FB]|uniref:DUF6221 family protein n=1 Tax=Streptomyces sp. 150FB TaxID=1576605 RepID=UPI0006980128|nr:DUF6221 family protein [Streptomyces sp. 150FB]
MSNLITFLRARLDEDEEAASAASPGPWHLNEEGDRVLAVDDITVAEAFALSDRQLRATAKHIVRHDPARALTDVEAKRGILAVHRPYVPEPDQKCLGCAGGIQWERCPVLRALALAYADHPHHSQDWRL